MRTTALLSRNRVGAVLATLTTAAVLVAVATGTGNPAAALDDTVSCQDLPHLWSGASEIAHNATDHTVLFVWGDQTHAEMRDTEPGCASQPGLEEELQGNRDGAVATEKADCRQLQNLVDAVRADRRSQGQSTNGRVPVSDNAQRAAARRAGTPEDIALAKRHLAPAPIDLDQADAVLARCPR